MASSLPRIDVAIGLAILAAGCGPAPEPWGAVTGRVLFQGKPAHPVVVLFSSPERGIEMTTVTDPDGNFQTIAAKNPGLPTGQYRVAIYPARYERPADGMTFPKSAEKDAVEIPAAYRDPKASGLVANVAEGPNHFPFDLK